MGFEMKPVEVKNVWGHNLEYEIGRIKKFLHDGKYSFASIDTEYPGIIHPIINHYRDYPAQENYQYLKKNVDSLKLIQLGLTLTVSNCNIESDIGKSLVWQFNFQFDLELDQHAPESIEFLKKQKIDFERLKVDGINHAKFARFFLLESGLFSGDYNHHNHSYCPRGSNVTWVTFHGAYDFGFLIKLLKDKPLPDGPDQLKNFIKLIDSYFGKRLYDIKYIMPFHMKIYGGLERAGKVLGIFREVGDAHQAGSDSLLTWRAFLKLSEKFDGDIDDIELYSGVLFGLEDKTYE
ncbi:hypothetical protein GIB67_014020 [Kingdonia uniflora]|uniref:poly(A)-specific ribonuclease n=1 Tax=Kingdonia uniflora TaxID=39325 RepID=A0A7J7L5H5_9MAGN|nr:hypothetical protein GIB67_014020 [Kingdonia uniflora]